MDYFIGWDVGGWNCDRNAASRDAVVIMDSGLGLVGKPWRGNLREAINQCASAADWESALFRLCAAAPPTSTGTITLAIDTPLGFSQEFVALISDGKIVATLGGSSDNPYLYRRTERYLFRRGFSPLSSIKDMIGSQTTKGMHVLAKFALMVESCGVWTDGLGFRAIEAYPSAARNSDIVRSLLSEKESLGNDDLDDARICASIAYLFTRERHRLEGPTEDIPSSEGWIWFPKRRTKEDIDE